MPEGTNNTPAGNGKSDGTAAGRAGPVEPGSYGVRDDGWRIVRVFVTKVSEQMFWYKEGRSTRERRGYKTSLTAWDLTEEAAGKLIERLNSVTAEKNRRERAAWTWADAEKRKLVAAAMGTPA